MKVEVVSRKLVKPYTPTPNHLKSYKISFLDEMIPPLNLGFPLFYQSKPKRISDLEESLSKILVQFYPLAGRFVKNDRRSVDCSDEGVEFIQAVAPDVELKELIAERNIKKLNQDFLPLPIYQVDEDAPIASFQITELKCGGMVLGISVSHKLLDTSSVKTFMAAWANANANANTMSPNFYSPSLFPCNDQICGEDLEHDPDVVVKRFELKKEAITKLRSKLINRSSRPVSRVRVVAAFIAMAMIRVDQAKHGRVRACVISQPVNMRERTIPPLPKHSCGNLAIVSSTRCIAAGEADDVGIQELVDLIGDAVEKSISDCAEMFFQATDRYTMINGPLDDFVAKLLSGEVNVMWFTDFTKFGFYETDLGWGKPDRVSFGPFAAEKMTVLLENKEGDGVEALVHLKHDDMSVFEHDEEIKLFATY